MDFVERCIFYLLILFFPTQLGKHFWPDFSIVSGIRIDYLSATLYITDVLLILLFGVFVTRFFRTFKKTKRLSPKFSVLFKKKEFYFISIFVIAFLFSNIYFSARPLLSLYGLAKLAEFVFLSLYIAKSITSLTSFAYFLPASASS